jgi:hypothetical protein
LAGDTFAPAIPEAAAKKSTAAMFMIDFLICSSFQALMNQAISGIARIGPEGAFL